MNPNDRAWLAWILVAVGLPILLWIHFPAVPAPIPCHEPDKHAPAHETASPPRPAVGPDAHTVTPAPNQTKRRTAQAPAPRALPPGFTEAPDLAADPAHPVANRVLRGLLQGAPVVDARDARTPDGGWLEKRIHHTGQKFPYVRVERRYDASGVLISERAMVADHLLVRVEDPRVTVEVAKQLEGAQLTIRQRLWTPGHLLVSGPPPTLEALERLEIRIGEAGAAISLTEPDYLVFASLEPNDPFYDLQWAIAPGDGADIDAVEAWDQSTGAPDVVIGVIDSGIDYEHPDLASNRWTNPGEIAGNAIDDDGNGLVDDVHGYDFANNDGDPMDDHYHGTHVAGTIAAAGNNGLGVTGVAWEAQLMAIKFLDDTGSGTLSGALDSITYAETMGADLTNNSWGASGTAPSSLADLITNSALPFVAAAGNSGRNTDVKPHFPSSIDAPNIISVAAHDERDQLAWFSNYGVDTVDISAPGVSIASTFPGNQYAYISGTSMAAPHVAGALALLTQRFPGATPAQLKALLLGRATPADYLDGVVVSGARLNLDQMIRVEDLEPPEFVGNPTANAVVGNHFQSQIDATNFPTAYDAVGLPAGLGVDTETGRISGVPTLPGEFTVTLSATNFAGTSTQEFTLLVELLAPTITSDLAAAADWNAAFAYQITADNGPDHVGAAGLPDGLSLDEASGLIAGTPTEIGTFHVALNAANDAGSVQETLVLTVHAPPAPTITSPLNDSAEVGFAYQYQITASDSPATFDALGLPNGLAVDPATGIITGAPTATGSFTVTLSATNPGGTGLADLELVVNLPDAPVITAEEVVTMRVGEAATYQINASNSPSSYDAEGLPDGLALDTATGEITGAPADSGQFTVSLTASNAGGAGMAHVVIDVLPRPPIITSPLTANATLGAPIGYQITATGAPTSFGANGLPDGVVVDPQTGALTGAPTELGAFPATISATNRGGTGSATLTLQVLPPAPVITSARTLEAEAGEPIRYQITATNHPTSFAASNLPEGLSIHTGTGVISGAVLTEGAYDTTITASNAGGATSDTLTINIAASPTRITAIAPLEVDPGGEFTLSGIGFTGATEVFFSNGDDKIPAPSFTVVNDTEMRVEAPFISMHSQTQPRLTVITPQGLATTLPPNVVEITQSTEVSGGLEDTYRVHHGAAVLANTMATFVIEDGALVTAANGGGLFYVKSGGTLDMTQLYFRGNIYYAPGALLLDAPIVAEDTQLSLVSVPHIRATVLAGKLRVSQTPRVASEPAATGTVGDYFHYELEVASGPGGLDVTVGALPEGLSYDEETREIDGYPTTPGVYAVDFILTNSNGTTDFTLTLTIGGDAIPVITTSGTYALSSGQAFELPITAANSPTSFDAAGLPPGLSIDSATGLITGAPTVGGIYPVTLSATNALGTGQRIVGFYVDDSPLTITDITPDRAYEGDTITLYGTGFNEVIKLTLFQPNGTPATVVTDLRIVSDTELTFIAPPMGQFRWDYSVILLETEEWAAVSFNSEQENALDAPIHVGPGATVLGDESVPYYVEPGGTVTFQGVYPRGVHFLADGATLDFANQNYPRVTVYQSPQANVINYNGFSWTEIIPMPSMRFYPLPKGLSIGNLAHIDPVDASGVVGQAFGYQIELTEPESISQYGAEGLPPGLSLNPSSGFISGSPTQAGTYSVTLSANNRAPRDGTAEVTFTITAPTLSALTSSYRVDGQTGVPLSHQITADNGPTGYALSEVPPGLSFDPATGELTGTPTQSGAFLPTLTITNAGGDRVYTLLIAIDEPMPVITSLPTNAPPGLPSTIPGANLANVDTGYAAGDPFYATALTPLELLDASPGEVSVTTPEIANDPRRPAIVLLASPGGMTVSLPDDTIMLDGPTDASFQTTYHLGDGASLNGVISGTRVYAGHNSLLQIEGGSRQLIFADNGARVVITGNQYNSTIIHAPNAVLEIEDTSRLTLIEVPDLSPSFVTNGYEVSQLPYRTSTATVRGFLNIPFFHALTASNSPTSYDANSLPPGLALNAATGEITGTPTAVGAFEAAITVFNAEGSTQSTLTVDVGNALDYWVFQNVGEDADASAAVNQDNNGDGIDDLINYATVSGLDDPGGARANLPDFVPADDDRATFTFRRIAGNGVGDAVNGYTIGGVRYVVLWSPDLLTWQTGPAVIEPVGSPVNNGDGSETVTVRAIDSLADHPSFFLLDVRAAE